MEIKKKSVIEFERTLGEQISLELFRKAMIDLAKSNDNKDCWFVSTTTGQCFTKEELSKAIMVVDAFLSSEYFNVE